MATDAQTSAPPDRRSTEDRGETLVGRRIASARRQLRLVDLASGVALLAICLLGYFLLLAVVEHWLVPLGTAARYLAWGVLLLGGGYFLVGRLLPAIIRPINPIFAAKTIEQGDPSLKNSLINFLLFRHRRAEVLPVVYQALEQQAAAGAARVSPDSMIDRSGLIKLGYVLAASLALFAVYEIGSPKDALQTAQRVLLPWADIAAPTRVTISEVTPADARAYRGFPVEVAAEVRGLRDDEPVTLLYSTADGQIVDRSIALTRESATGHRFTGTLPESGGVTQNLRYRIAAGDCRTPEYTITALDEPMVVITRVEYHPPKYTGRESRVVEGVGDLKALEQTLVTLHAEANYPLASGTIEFDPDTVERPRGSPLEVEGNEARVSLRLELDSDRKTAKYRTYQLRIVTEDQATNAQPILHTIEVVADLVPEVEILAPADRLVELPQDGRLTIEARAIDPDFGLSALQLRANQGGQSLLDQALLGEGEQPRQHRGEYLFEPAKLGLAVGAEVVYWAEAADNRTAQPEGTPAPNRAKTDQYRIRVTPPANPPPQQQGEGEGNPEQSPDNQQDPSGNPDANNSAENQGEQPGEGQPGGAEGEPGEGAEGEGAEGKGAEGESQSGAEQQGEGAGGESQQEGELGEGSGDERTGQGSNPNGPEGADQEGSGGNQSLGEGGTKAGDQTDGSNGEPGGTDPGAGAQPSGNAGEAGQQNDTPEQGGGGENSRPLDAEGAEDAEAFQRAKEFFQEQQRKQEQAAGSPNGAGEQSPQANSDPASANPQDNPSPQQGTEGQPQDPNASGGGTSKPGDPQDATGENPGGMPQGADDRRAEEAAGTGPQEQNPERNGGQGTTGESGAGKPADPDSQGAPEAQGENRDTPKNGTDSGQGEKPNEEAQSPSVSKQQSDSEGEQGDRSGGGGEGGGQGAKQPGNDSPGSTTAADEGAGAASESGEGETGDGPGSQQTAEGQTGQSGEQSGNGSRNQAGAEGAQPGEGQTNNQQPGEASDQAGDPSNTGGESQQSPNGDSPQRGGAGAPGRAPSADREFPDDAVPPADEVNLDYARQATDLVLDKLEQQTEQPNQELLDRLGWTPEQLQQFVSRWKAMKEKSQQSGEQGEEARRELDEALQSLGLVPEASRRIETQRDSVGGTRDAGFRSQPPAEYQRLYDAFRKSGE